MIREYDSGVWFGGYVGQTTEKITNVRWGLLDFMSALPPQLQPLNRSGPSSTSSTQHPASSLAPSQQHPAPPAAPSTTQQLHPAAPSKQHPGHGTWHASHASCPTWDRAWIAAHAPHTLASSTQQHPAPSQQHPGEWDVACIARVLPQIGTERGLQRTHPTP